MKIDDKQLTERLDVIFDSACDEDWIWNGEDEMRTMTFDYGHAMTAMKKLLRDLGVEIT